MAGPGQPGRGEGDRGGGERRQVEGKEVNRGVGLQGERKEEKRTGLKIIGRDQGRGEEGK